MAALVRGRDWHQRKWFKLSREEACALLLCAIRSPGGTRCDVMYEPGPPGLAHIGGHRSHKRGVSDHRSAPADDDVALLTWFNHVQTRPREIFHIRRILESGGLGLEFIHRSLSRRNLGPQRRQLRSLREPSLNWAGRLLHQNEENRTHKHPASSHVAQ